MPKITTGVEFEIHVICDTCGRSLRARVANRERDHEIDVMPCKTCIDRIAKSEPVTGPTANQQYYRPQEFVTRYPLELTSDLQICLWSPDGTNKWTIALWWGHPGQHRDLRFIGNRPLDPRVNWSHLRELIEQGQRMEDDQYCKTVGAKP